MTTPPHPFPQLAPNLEALIVGHPKSAKDIADAIHETTGANVSRITVWRWSKGMARPNDSLLPAVAAFFEVDLKDLLFADLGALEDESAENGKAAALHETWDRHLEALLATGEPLSKEVRILDLNRLRSAGELPSKSAIARRWKVHRRTVDRTLIAAESLNS